MKLERIGRGGGPGGTPPDEPYLDLPLGREEPEPADEPAVEHGPAPRGPDPGPAPGGVPSGGPPATGRRRGGLPWLAVALVLAALALAAGWLLRPDPALLRASAPLLDFGARRLGGDAKALELRLTNGGGRRLSISEVALAGEGAADYALIEDGCTGARLAAGESCALAVGFEPGAEGARRAVLEIDARAANAPLAVPLLGAGAAARLAVGRGELSFGAREVGSSGAPSAVTVENRGGAPVVIEEVRIEGPAAGDFRAGGRCADRTLAPGGSCAVTFVFAPRAAGERRASARVVSDVPGPAPVVTLHGTGTERAPELVFAPASLDFGTAAVGAEPRERELTVTNRGDAPARVAAVRLAETGRGFRVVRDGCAGKSLAPGGSCKLTVGFSPASAAAVETPLRVELTGGGAGPWARLTGRGEGVRMAAAPERLDFGLVRLGESGEARVAVSNPGRVPLVLRRLAVEGPDAAEFRPAGGCREGEQLAPGESCALAVRFVPGSIGERLARLVVEPTAAGRLEVALSGEAVPAPVARARAVPSTIAFGEEPVGGRSGIRDATLDNPGDRRLTLSGTAIEGRDAGDFRIVPGSCTGAGFLAPGGDCTVGVRFTPTAPGPRRAELVFRHDAAGGGRSAVRLEGVGTAQ